MIRENDTTYYILASQGCITNWKTSRKSLRPEETMGCNKFRDLFEGLNKWVFTAIFSRSSPRVTPDPRKPLLCDPQKKNYLDKLLKLQPKAKKETEEGSDCVKCASGKYE